MNSDKAGIGVGMNEYPPSLTSAFMDGWLAMLSKSWGSQTIYPFARIEQFFAKKINVCAPLLSYGCLKPIEAKKLFDEQKSTCQIRYLDTFEKEIRVGSSVQSFIPIGNYTNAETFWESGMSGNLRKKIRKAERSGLNARISRNGDDLKLFYKHYGVTMHRHGTPPYGYRLFERILESVESELIIVGKGEETVATYFVIYDKEIALFQWAGFNPNVSLDNASVLGEWTAIQEAFKRRLALFDLGRSALGVITSHCFFNIFQYQHIHTFSMFT